MSLASTFENFEDELGQILDHNCDGNFQSYFDEDLDLHDELETTFLETQIHLGFEQSMSDLIEEERKEFRYYIQSVVGDDEHITTNSKMLAPCLIGFGPIINGIKISWKDTGISKYIGNYAEGWILTPPSAEASFEATVRRHKISGVPFVLDPVKTKLLSPVRKQTSIEDNDLESKLSQLSEIASWTDSSWFTYDYHQMALLLSISIFDFQDANSFPFLYKAEGGCGGVPPYGNLDTAYSALHHYTRGKSHRAILGIMIEAVQVNLGHLKPQDTFFLKSARLANMGDQAWLRYISAYKSLQTSKVLSTSEINELLKDTEGSTLPPEILQLGAEVEPKNFAVGATIRALRKDGFIMSELDVKAAYDEKQREMALLGDKQIGLLKREQKEEWKLFKGNHMKILSKISENSPIIRESIKSKLGIIPTEPTDEHHDVLYTYYRLRSENYESFTSFHYTDSVRIFKTNEINDMLGHEHHQIRQDFAMTESFPKWKKKFLEENTDEKRRLTEIDEWIDSAPLDELLEKPFPPGIGTDDARIVRNIIDRISEHNLEAYEMIVVIMFSADRQLARTTAIQCSEWISAKVVVGQIDKAGYTAICLEGLSEWESLKARSELDVIGNPRMRIRGREREVKYYNYLLRRHWWIPTAALEEIIKRSDNPGYFRSRKSFLFHVEYDYPNMERGLDLIKYEPKTHSIREYGGGFLERRTLEGMGPDKCWAGKSYDEIKSWPDFDEHEVKRYYRRKKYFNDNRVTIVNPMNPATYNRIDYWKRNTFPNVLEIDNIQRQTITGP